MSDAERKVTLPTGLLLTATWLACLLAGGAWAVGGWIIAGRDVALAGAVAAGLVGTAAALVLVLIRPWHPRPLMQWPVVWVAGSFVRLIATMGGSFLLYSAAPIGGRSLWFAVALVYVAAMIAETRVYAMSMKRIAPGGAEASTPE